ncbi:MAG: rod shape-determining protein RodA [Candidatus Buchananbacteria bacterium RBG_13_39_9]|uniref:Rod shape-determining protein RodA n=1 Tax=Candidatus Buchananbacteria bacterium RBG_13_39_9 TaxID=1797531 RepID=A0A1G1XR18_9BACT|nr:MAG: rod shape-determining protein RodA [Candidatus Buchananbacteria bacterium RBG_13_39_9]
MKFTKFNAIIKKLDWLLLINVCLLIILGIILIYSVALGSQSEQNYLNFKKQIVFFIFGLIGILIISLFIDYRILIKANAFFYILGVILLLSVLFFGKTIRGTTGWFNLGIFSFQPVEFVKIFLIIFLSKFFSDKARYIGQLKYLIASSLGVIVLMILVVLQPDFGSALILFGLWAILILLTGIKKSHLLLISSIILISSLILWFFVFQPYQKQRIMVFVNPALDPLGSGYNITQAIIAIGSGNLWGKGLTLGSQSQLKFLPESQTDFIFAVLSEELGLLGIILLLALFGFLFWRLLYYARKINDNFAIYLIISTCVLFFVELIVNIGGNLGLLPITGITLPFVSYGGSSLLANMILIGLIESVIARSQ